jgi:hypothetical protein
MPFEQPLWIGRRRTTRCSRRRELRFAHRVTSRGQTGATCRAARASLMSLRSPSRCWADMRKTWQCLVAALLAMSCAGRANLDELDRLQSEHGRSGWKVYRGTQTDFGASLPVCITGLDEGRRLDMTELIVRGVSQELAGFVNACDETKLRIRAEYQGDYSLCTDCGDPGLSTRFGTAFVRIESPIDGWLSDAIWSDTRGGPAEEVAARFARALGTFLREARSSYRGSPPNFGMERPWPSPVQGKADGTNRGFVDHTGSLHSGHAAERECYAALHRWCTSSGSKRACRVAAMRRSRSIEKHS